VRIVWYVLLSCLVCVVIKEFIIKFNIGVITQEGFIKAHIIVFENGIVLHSKSSLWIGTTAADQLKLDFEQVIEALKNGSLEFDDKLQSS
jgi:hypothetical protein